MTSMTHRKKADLITHGQDAPLDLTFHSAKLEFKTNLTLPLDAEKELLQQLSEFELGRFLLGNQGLNGYWTAYVILQGLKKTDLHPLEQWMLTKAPIIRATRERFHIFQTAIQQHLKSNQTIASIPCGLMDDLLSLDYTHVSNVHLVGIDLDGESLKLARHNADHYGQDNVSFIESNAWTLGAQNTYDIVVSNGLNIYVADDQKNQDLYRAFYTALKPGGILITSFITPPPAVSPESPWHDYDEVDALKQRALLVDIIETTWQNFRTESHTRAVFESVGFTILDVIPDSCGMFPTLIAMK